MGAAEALLSLLGSADLASRRWIWEQYDYTVMADTVATPGGDAGIVRHRGKIESAINNARRALELIDAHGSIAAYVWQYEATVSPRRRVTRGNLPVTTPESIALSKDLKKLEWSFVGPTGMYALMQAIGLVNDHVGTCDIRLTIEKQHRTMKRPVSDKPIAGPTMV